MTRYTKLLTARLLYKHCSPDGTRWRLLSSEWINEANQASEIMLCRDELLRIGAELIKEGVRRFLFRFESQNRGSVFIKSFPLSSIQRRLRHRRYGWSEVVNLLEAKERGVPVPSIFGYGEHCAWGMVDSSVVMMQDLKEHVTLSKLLGNTFLGPKARHDLLRRTIPLFTALYRGAVNHIDVNANNLLIYLPDPVNDMIIDFQYARFLPAPSVEVFLSQAGRFLHSVGSNLLDEEREAWINELLATVEIVSTNDVFRRLAYYCTDSLSRAYRLNLSRNRRGRS